MDMNFLNPVNNSVSSLFSQVSEDIQNKEVTGDFKELMQMMIPLFAMQTFTSMGTSSSSDSQNPYGFNFNSFITPIMMSLLEEIMSMELGGQEDDALPMSGGIESLEDAKNIHINQFDAEISVGGDGANANCGPTSLAIALHSLGIPVQGEGTIANSGLTVDHARKSMVADPARDGMGANGQRLESEHSTWTNFEDLDRGARAAGAKTSRITATAKDTMESLVRGGVVIVSGTFTGKYPLPWTGDRGVDNQSAPGNATGHIVAVTGYDPSSGAFIVNDPARNEPFLLDGQKLEYFMRGNAGALEIRREQ